MNLPKEFNLTNCPWECPRCGQMNAPFNSFCSCKSKDNEELELMITKQSEHVMDAERYLSAKGQAQHKAMTLPAGMPYGFKKS